MTTATLTKTNLPLTQRWRRAAREEHQDFGSRLVTAECIQQWSDRTILTVISVATALAVIIWTAVSVAIWHLLVA
jgi:Lon protease-like protein